MPLEPNTILKNRYRVESTLGEGGMGAVYRAFDINLGVPVAVKENLFSTIEYARQFRREATILASLRHPNLPRVTDHFVIEDEGQYLVMDFIEGVDLRVRLEDSGAVDEEEALPWFLEICDALSYLHTRVPPILHRDIKPGNLKITPEGRAILVDFGLAKEVTEGSVTSTGAKAMTPGFSPPEQYGTGRTDARTDIYSLGATMYAALLTSVPEDALERAMDREELTPVREMNPSISPAVARAIEHSLEVRAEDRFQTVAEFGAELAASSEASRPTMVRTYPHLDRTMATSDRTTISTPDDLDNGGRRRWPGIILIVFSLFFVVVITAYLLPDIQTGLFAVFGQSTETAELQPTVTSNTNQGEVQPSPTSESLILATTEATPSEEAANGEPTPTDLPAIEATPTGGGIGQLVFASDRTGNPQLYLINVDGQGLSQLTSLPDGACQPAWSPDGLQIVFTTPCRDSQEQYEGSSLWVLTIESGSIEPLPTEPGGDFDPAWSPDGTRIIFTSLRDNNRPQIYTMNMDDRNIELLSEPNARDRQPAWAPTGTQIAFASRRTGPSEIWLMPEFGAAGQRLTLSGGNDNSHPNWSIDGLVLYEQDIGGIPRLIATRFEDRGTPEFRICPEGPLSVQPMAEGRWSPDGRWIAFETWPTGDNHEIAIMTESCTNYTELTSDPALDFDPDWHP